MSDSLGDAIEAERRRTQQQANELDTKVRAASAARAASSAAMQPLIDDFIPRMQALGFPGTTTVGARKLLSAAPRGWSLKVHTREHSDDQEWYVFITVKGLVSWYDGKHERLTPAPEARFDFLIDTAVLRDAMAELIVRHTL
jgi:hypothetical protein